MLLKPSMIISRATALPPSRSVDRNAGSSARALRETSHSDEIITPEISLTVPGVLAAFTILCEDISSLPLVLYQRGPGEERQRAYGNSYYSLMHDAPNSEHTSMTFREIEMGHLLAWGNFYAQIITDRQGNVAELWPLRPDRMTVQRVDGEKVYRYLTSEGKPVTFLRDEILHVPAFGFDGLVGYSRIALARNTIGLAMATERFGSKFFANDARPGIALKHPTTLSDTAYQRLVASWDDKHKGADNAHKTAILEEGLDIAEIGFPPEDAQFIETQRWTVAQIARVFRVPPHMIGDTDRSTSWGTGIDSQEQGYVNHTLRPWTVRIEQSHNQQLLLPDERKIYFWEHLFDALVRGDLTTRYATYTQAITNGIMSPNEVRRKENMSPYEGGDVYVLPLNTGPADQTDDEDAPEEKTPDEDMEDMQARTRPLFLDAAQRVLRRETSELRDAGQRWLDKGKAEKYQAWVEQFYKQSLPSFALSVFQPLIDANLISLVKVQTWLAIFCEVRGDQARTDANISDYPPADFVRGLLE